MSGGIPHRTGSLGNAMTKREKEAKKPVEIILPSDCACEGCKYKGFCTRSSIGTSVFCTRLLKLIPTTQTRQVCPAVIEKAAA